MNNSKCPRCFVIEAGLPDIDKELLVRLHEVHKAPTEGEYSGTAGKPGRMTGGTFGNRKTTEVPDPQPEAERAHTYDGNGQHSRFCDCVTSPRDNTEPPKPRSAEGSLSKGLTETEYEAEQITDDIGTDTMFRVKPKPVEGEDEIIEDWLRDPQVSYFSKRAAEVIKRQREDR